MKEGKTSYKHAYDQLYLYAEEYEWLVTFVRLRRAKMVLSKAPKYFMTTMGRGEVRLVNDVRKAWEEMGLPGQPDIMAIRSAVCTYVS